MAEGIRIRVDVDVHHAVIAAALRSPQGAPMRFVEGRCLIVENLAKGFCPVDEGRLRNSIGHRVRVEEGRIVGSVGSRLDYAKFVHDGTGIYGPRRQFIYPKSGNFLVFQVKTPFGPMPKGKRRPAKGRRPVVFARRVRGTPPTKFLTRALEAGMPGAAIRLYT